MVIVFTGLPGTGKSTLADRAAAVLGVPSFAGDWLLGALAPHGVLRGLDRPTYLRLSHDLLGTLIDWAHVEWMRAEFPPLTVDAEAALAQVLRHAGPA
ncbi:hypothetical protein DY240_10775 [Jiangella rhizosphaerae]|uniref:Uncharacterized protein n=2 Tax=Jiangella rhizosphaerae TaxID=2293569 RepID=A0A418KSE4_9ACTN|nr:hypothetical protein DY240_10775 [Jiangella rhizosphaerae]